WYCDGKVPGGNQTNHTHRVAQRHTKLVGHLDWRSVTEQAAALTAHVVGHVDGFLYVTARLGDNLAHFLSHQAGKLLLTLGKQLRHPEENFAPARRGGQS